jgi:hypothetical protein
MQVAQVDHEISSTVLVVVLLSMLLAELTLPLLVSRLRLLPLPKGAQANTRDDHDDDDASAYSLLLPIKDDEEDEEDEEEEGLGSAEANEEHSLSSSSSTSRADGGQSWLGRTFAKLDRQVLVKLFAGPRYGIEEEGQQGTGPDAASGQREGHGRRPQQEGHTHMPTPHHDTATAAPRDRPTSPKASVSPLSVLMADSGPSELWHDDDDL